MSKAEERALEKYPLMADNDKEGLEALKYIGMECECASVFNEAQEAKQAYFIEGYHQAEKDLELTIEDIERIHTFLYAIKHNKQGVFTFTRLSDEQYQEVLRRFNKLKG
jgi:hypothetical protein